MENKMQKWLASELSDVSIGNLTDIHNYALASYEPVDKFSIDLSTIIHDIRYVTKDDVTTKEIREIVEAIISFYNDTVTDTIDSVCIDISEIISDINGNSLPDEYNDIVCKIVRFIGDTLDVYMPNKQGIYSVSAWTSHTGVVVDYVKF